MRLPLFVYNYPVYLNQILLMAKKAEEILTKEESAENKSAAKESTTLSALSEITFIDPGSNSSMTDTSVYLTSSAEEKIKKVEKEIADRIEENPLVADNKPFRYLASVKKLMEANAHVGLYARRWNPKMKKYILCKKGVSHIIDLYWTLVCLNIAYNFLKDLASKYNESDSVPILIVGTRGRHIKIHVKDQAKRAKAYFINERWLGGTLTNFTTIQKSIGKFNNLILLHKSGEVDKYTKKEKVSLRKQTEKYAKYFLGIRTMKEKPAAIVLIHPEHNKIAIQEAKKLDVPIIAICNTNTNVDHIDYPIPGNNSSVKAVFLLLGILMDAVAEARGEEIMYAERSDEDIFLPEIARKKPELKKVASPTDQPTPTTETKTA